MKGHIVNLNHQQQAAVEHLGTPQIIIAGAGTGKTTVMIEKINYLIATKTQAPHNILALTFTNKAANEMKTRFNQFSTHSQRPFFGTFHSFCLRFLKASPCIEQVGLTKNFTIIDFQQQKEVLQKLTKNNNISLNKNAKDTLSKISAIKQFPHHEHAELLSQATNEIQTLFKPYNQQLRALNCVDFDDLLLHTYTILATQPSELERMQSIYQYLIIDEYQDTNTIQNELCILLAKQHQNICVVGDFDQTIYSWRGAKVENLLEFNTFFPTATTYKLEINYRSTKEILGAANQLIEFNSTRMPKKLVTDRSNNQAIEHIICYDEHQEAQTIVQHIKKHQKNDNYSLKDFAILYRTNQQSRAIEEALTKHNVPHTIVGTTPFYQRQEVKHCIAYLQCLNNINQPIWFERAMLNPSRGVGKRSIEKLIDFCTTTNQTIETAIDDEACPLTSRYKTEIKTFIQLIAATKLKNATISEQLTILLNSVDMNTHLRKLDNPEDRENNIKELLSKCKDINNLDDFLNEITLFQDAGTTEDTDKVSCLTLHLAKGLEFPIVFIPGFENDLLPLRNTDSIEEERRLAYVGITRGKDQVYLLSTYKRTLMGDDWYHDISTFSTELSNTVTIKMTQQAYNIGKAIVFKLSDAELSFKVIKESSSKPIIHATKTIAKVFDIGDVVQHPSWGAGVIQKQWRWRFINVHYSIFRIKKTVLAKFAPLEQAT